MSRILAKLSSESLDNAPIEGAGGDRLLELTAEEINAQQDSAEFGAIRALVQNWHTECRNARIPEERQWFKNIDMVQGRQFTMWHPIQSKMVEPPRQPQDIRIAVNICEPVARTEMAKTGANAPTAVVAPASNDIDDVMAAQAGEAAWEWWHEEQNFQTKVFTPSNWWRTITGMGFIKVFYDQGSIDPAGVAAAVRLQREEQREREAMDAQQGGLAFLRPGASFGPAAEAAPAKPEVYGAIKGESVTPFHIYIPDPAVLDIQDQPYVIHAYTRKVEQARLAYGDRLPADWSPSPIGANTVVDLQRLGIRGYPAISPDAVLILECWIKPGYHSRFPKGGLVILCGEHVVHLAKEGLPYEHGQYPFAMLTGIENGKFYRKSVIESITPLQNELNHTVGQIIKRKNLATNPGYFYDEGSLNPRQVANIPGIYIPIRLGMQRPTAIPIGDLPTFIPQLLDRIKMWTDDISGQHQVSRAISPGADTAASALALLKETDDDFLSPSFDSIETSMKTVGRQVLSLMVQFWEEPRLVKVIGSESGFDAKMLKGSDLVSGTDLRMESGTSLPTSKTAKIAQITEWIDKGIIPAEVGLAAMEMGTLGRLYRRIKLDQDQAQRENIEIRDLDPLEVQAQMAEYEQALQQSQMQTQMQADAAMQGLADPAAAMQAAPPAPPSIYPIGWQDNDEVHIMEHKAFAKGQVYAALDPSVQKVLEQHVAEHEARLQQQMMTQAMMGAAPADPTAEPGYDDSQVPEAGAA